MKIKGKKMYQNINRINRKQPYINGKPNFDAENHEIKKAPIKRLLEQNTVIDKDAKYQLNLNVFPDAIELVQNHIETTIKQIATIATNHALNKAHRATIMPDDITYAIQKIKGDKI
jgi:histone H3/H4